MATFCVGQWCVDIVSECDTFPVEDSDVQWVPFKKYFIILSWNLLLSFDQMESEKKWQELKILLKKSFILKKQKYLASQKSHAMVIIVCINFEPDFEAFCEDSFLWPFSDYFTTFLFLAASLLIGASEEIAATWHVSCVTLAFQMCILSAPSGPTTSWWQSDAANFEFPKKIISHCSSLSADFCARKWKSVVFVWIIAQRCTTAGLLPQWPCWAGRLGPEPSFTPGGKSCNRSLLDEESDHLVGTDPFTSKSFSAQFLSSVKLHSKIKMLMIWRKYIEASPFNSRTFRKTEVTH